LCEYDLALIVRILVQEPSKRLELLRQPLSVVEAVNTNDAQVVERAADLGLSQKGPDHPDTATSMA
jgi:hypothetical protein